MRGWKQMVLEPTQPPASTGPLVLPDLVPPVGTESRGQGHADADRCPALERGLCEHHARLYCVKRGVATPTSEVRESTLTTF